jgi:hypothetical protein
MLRNYSCCAEHGSASPCQVMGVLVGSSNKDYSFAVEST